MKTALLKLRHIRKSFNHKKVLNEVFLTIPEHSFISIVGESGSGKSSLLKIINGLVKIDSGEVIKNMKSDQIQFVFQNYSLFPWLNVKENICQAPKIKGLNSEKIEKRATFILEEVGLTEQAHLYPNELSGGMKQRVAIARALMMKPKLILMDEPFAALDIKTKQKLHELTLKLFQEHKMSIVFVSHDISEALFLGDKVYVMDKKNKNFHLPMSIPFARPRSKSLLRSTQFKRIEAKIKEKFLAN